MIGSRLLLQVSCISCLVSLFGQVFPFEFLWVHIGFQIVFIGTAGDLVGEAVKEALDWALVDDSELFQYNVKLKGCVFTWFAFGTWTLCDDDGAAVTILCCRETTWVATLISSKSKNAAWYRNMKSLTKSKFICIHILLPEIVSPSLITTKQVMLYSLCPIRIFTMVNNL